jgi:hypothetical protein
MPESPPGLTPGHDRLRLYCLDCFRYWAQSGHADRQIECQLFGEERTCRMACCRLRHWRKALQRCNVATLHPANVAPKRQLRAAPHMSLYVGKRVQRALKEIALEYDRKAHDILIEAVDMVLQRCGRPTVAELPDDV